MDDCDQLKLKQYAKHKDYNCFLHLQLSLISVVKHFLLYNKAFINLIEKIVIVTIIIVIIIIIIVIITNELINKLLVIVK